MKLGNNTAVTIDPDEEEEQLILTPSHDRQSPEEDVVFCFEGGLISGIFCSITTRTVNLLKNDLKR